jgi:hypothetical protein
MDTVTTLCGTEVGKQNEALETLHHAILHKRWKNQWSASACLSNQFFEALPILCRGSMINVSLSDFTEAAIAT